MLYIFLLCIIFDAQRSIPTKSLIFCTHTTLFHPVNHNMSSHSWCLHHAKLPWIRDLGWALNVQNWNYSALVVRLIFILHFGDSHVYIYYTYLVLLFCKKFLYWIHKVLGLLFYISLLIILIFWCFVLFSLYVVTRCLGKWFYFTY